MPHTSATPPLTGVAGDIASLCSVHSKSEPPGESWHLKATKDFRGHLTHSQFRNNNNSNKISSHAMSTYYAMGTLLSSLRIYFSQSA